MGSYLINPITRNTFQGRAAPTGTTMAANQQGIVPSAAGAAAINAPAIVSDRMAFAIVDADGQAGTNNITVSGNGNLIDGAASVVLATNGIVAVFLWDTTYGQWKRALPERQYSDDAPVTFTHAADTPGGSVSLPTVDPTPNGLRLSLATNQPVPGGDVATSSTVFFTPYTSGAIALFTAGAWVLRVTAQVSLALSGLAANTNYDVFAYWTGSAVAIELSLAWSTDTVRNEAISRLNGVFTKTSDTTRRYVGTIRTISTTQTTDTATQRFVYNGPEPSRQVLRPLFKGEATASWVYGTATWRQANATVANRVEFVVGDPNNSPVMATAQATVQGTALTAVATGIGLDSTTVNSAQSYGMQTEAAGAGATSVCSYDAMVGIGYHALNWLEIAGGSTCVWLGAISPQIQSGIRAKIAA